MSTDIRAFANVDPEIMGGTPVFKGTRVPIRILPNWMANGETLEFFLECYPSVSREQAQDCMNFMAETLQQIARSEYESAA